MLSFGSLILTNGGLGRVPTTPKGAQGLTYRGFSTQIVWAPFALMHPSNYSLLSFNVLRGGVRRVRTSIPILDGCAGGNFNRNYPLPRTFRLSYIAVAVSQIFVVMLHSSALFFLINALLQLISHVEFCGITSSPWSSTTKTQVGGVGAVRMLFIVNL